MREIKSTILGLALIIFGGFMIHNHLLDVEKNNYMLIGIFGLICLGSFLFLTDKITREKWRKRMFEIVKLKFKK